MATEAALAFAPEVVEMCVRKENVQGTWWCILAISASDALLTDIQDLYAKKGFKECSTRDAFDRPPRSARFFMDAGKLHVRAVGGASVYPVPDRLLRLCLAALAARGLAPAPAEPAALAAGAAGPQAATVVDLDELWRRAWQPGGLRSLWLPRAPSARPAAAAPAGEAILHISAGSVLADVQRLFNCAALPPGCSHSILLAWVVPALARSGYELVAPKRLAEHSKSLAEQGTDFDTQFQQLSRMSIQAPLVFVEQARLTSEQSCIDDARSVEDCTSAGAVTIQTSANGVVSLFDAPREARLAIEEAHPWVCSDMASQLQGLSLEFSPKLIEVLLASVTSLGYEQVAAPGEPVAGAYRFSQPSRPAVQPQEASSVVEQAPQADSEELAATTQAQANTQHALPAESEALSEEVTSSMEACRAEFEAKLCAQEESSRQAMEALQAELVETLRDQRDDARAQQQAGLEALEAVRSQAEELQAQLQAQGEECARLVEEQRLLRNELERARKTQQSSHEAEEIQAGLRAQAQESARLAEEQRRLRNDLQKAREMQQGSYEACRAELEAKVRAQAEEAARRATGALRMKLMEALREQPDDAHGNVREKEEAGLEAFEELQEMSKRLLAAAHAMEQKVQSATPAVLALARGSPGKAGIGSSAAPKRDAPDLKLDGCASGASDVHSSDSPGQAAVAQTLVAESAAEAVEKDEAVEEVETGNGCEAAEAAEAATAAGAAEAAARDAEATEAVEAAEAAGPSTSHAPPDSASEGAESWLDLGGPASEDASSLGASHAATEPAVHSAQCLSSEAHVLVPVVDVARIGRCTVAGPHGAKACMVFPQGVQERDFVALRTASGTTELTSTHRLAVRRKAGWTAIEAREVRENDVVRTSAGEEQVAQAQLGTRSASAFELEVADGGEIFIWSPDPVNSSGTSRGHFGGPSLAVLGRSSTCEKRTSSAPPRLDDLPSEGSRFHPTDGSPCKSICRKFQRQEGCPEGRYCGFCHMDHQGQSKRSARGMRSTRR